MSREAAERRVNHRPQNLHPAVMRYYDELQEALTLNWNISMAFEGPKGLELYHRPAEMGPDARTLSIGSLADPLGNEDGAALRKYIREQTEFGGHPKDENPENWERKLEEVLSGKF